MNKRPYFFLIVVLALSLVLASCDSTATSTPEPTEETAVEPTEVVVPTPANMLESIKANGKLLVGTSADYPPYESKDEAGNFVGFDMDLIREVGKRLGVEVVIQDMGFDTLIAGVQQGKIDAVIAAMQGTPERDEQVDFSTPYNWQKDAFVVAGDSPIVMNTPQDAAGHTIGVQTGTIQEKWVLENLVPLGTTEDQIFRYERVDQGALDVSNGRIDMLFINAAPAAELAETGGLKLALVTSDTVAAGQAIAIKNGETALKAEIDRILAEMEQDGTIQKLKDLYGIL
jgi:polar amino acid transport system substrate-binding protein